jgi:hypothetical protein
MAEEEETEPEAPLPPLDIPELNELALMVLDPSADQQQASDPLMAAYKRADF